MGFRDRKFGVELEFTAPKIMWKNADFDIHAYDAAGALVSWHLNYNLDLDFNSSHKKGGWTLDSEDVGSFVAPCGLELTTPIMQGVRDMRLLKEVAGELQNIGCVTDKSCGLHVHVDVSDLNTQQVAAVLARYHAMEKKIDNLVDQNRNNNDMCLSMEHIVPRMVYEAMFAGKSKSARRRWADKAYDRYFKVNARAICDHGTLEFRHHHGTLDPERIEAWVKFCINFIDQTVKEMKSFKLNKKNVPVPETSKPFWLVAQQGWYPKDVSYAFPKWSQSPLKGLQQKTRKTLQSL